MAKALKIVGTAIVIAGAVALTGGAALMGGFAGSTTLFGVSAQTLMQVGTLVSTVGGALSQPKTGAYAGQASEWTANPNGPLHFAAGRIGIAGDVIHKAAFGPNDRMYKGIVTVVSAAGPIDGWESFTANDTAVTFDAQGKANSSYYANVMWLDRLNGTQPATRALASPSGLEGSATLTDWGSGYKLSGKAAFMLTLSENSKGSAYGGSEPPVLQVIRGLKGWDPVQDSTYPGGSGPCRLNDPSTWVYLTNPIKWGLKWALGLWEGPVGKGAPHMDPQVGGIGLKVGSIDVASFVEAANIADAHGWTVCAWPSTDDDKSQVLDGFLQAGGAYYIEKAGRMACLHRSAPRASVATITAVDTAGDIQLDTSASYVDRKNTGVPTFVHEESGWKAVALGEVTSPSWVAEDGGRSRSTAITYGYVSDATQAAQLICLGVAHTREGISGKIPLKPYMQGIEPGDAFTILEEGFVLNNLKCLCLETSYDAATGIHTVTFVSETDGKYDFAYGQSPTPPAPPALTPVDPTYVSPPLPGEWTVTVPGPAPDGTQFPTIDLTGIVDNATADSMLISWRAVVPGEDPEVEPDYADDNGVVLPGWVDAGAWPPTTTQLSIQGPQSGSVVWLAIRYRRGNNVSAPVLKGPVTVGTLTTTIDADNPALTDLRDTVAANLAAARAALEAADAALSTALTSAVDTLGDAISEVDSGLDGLQIIVAQNTTDLADKASITALNAQITRIDGNTAQLVTLSTTVADLPNQYVSSATYGLLSSEVAAARNGSATLGAQLTTMRQTVTDGLAGKASTTDLTALNSEVVGARNGSPNLSAQLSSMRQTTADGLAGKASASDLTTLTARVTSAEGVNTAQNTRLTTVESDLVGKASAATVTALTTTVEARPKTYTGSNAAGQPQPPGPRVVGDIWIVTNLQNRPYVWNGSTWVDNSDGRVSDLLTTTTTLSANYLSQQSAISDLTTGKASVSDVSALTTTVNGHTSQITTASSLAAAADGKASAIWGVAFDVNGKASGFASVNDGTTSSFSIAAEKFEVAAPNGGSSTSFANGAWKIRNAGVLRVQIGDLSA